MTPTVVTSLREFLDYIDRLEAENRGLVLENQRLRTERDAYLAHWGRRAARQAP